MDCDRLAVWRCCVHVRRFGRLGTENGDATGTRLPAHGDDASPTGMCLHIEHEAVLTGTDFPTLAKRSVGHRDGDDPRKCFDEAAGGRFAAGSEHLGSVGTELKEANAPDLLHPCEDEHFIHRKCRGKHQRMGIDQVDLGSGVGDGDAGSVGADCDGVDVCVEVAFTEWLAGGGFPAFEDSVSSRGEDAGPAPVVREGADPSVMGG